jgi:hypothetical protein
VSAPAFAPAVSTHYRADVARSEMAIRRARLRAPLARVLLDAVQDILCNRVIVAKLVRAEVEELEKLACDLADCGMFEASGDVSPFMDRSIRARLAMLVARAKVR